MEGQVKGQLVKYNFYAVEPEWRRLPEADRERGKAEFMAVVDEFSSHMFLRSYCLVGLRHDADFLLWQACDTLEELQEMAIRLRSTHLGRYLQQPYSYLSMTRRSQYVEGHRHVGQEGAHVRLHPGDAGYFIVYPFVKTHDWYQLPQEERQQMMNEHFLVGHKYPSVKINTTYSFGLDDNDFVVAFETDSPDDFLELVMELRSSRARPYTERDTPIFTCIHRPLKETLDALG